MAFMEPQVEYGQWLEIDTTNGTEFIPADLISLDIELNETSENEEHLEEVAQYCEGEPQSVKLREGWGCRLSAPGYMDCTEWSVFETEKEAKEHLDEMYGGEDADECDECNRSIPNGVAGGLANKHHDPSCSLFDESEE